MSTNPDDSTMEALTKEQLVELFRKLEERARVAEERERVAEERERAAEERERVAKEEKRAAEERESVANRIARHEYFVPFTKFLEPKQQPYEGGYKKFRKRVELKDWERPPDYCRIVNKLSQLAKADGDGDISMASYHSHASDNSSAGEKQNDVAPAGGKPKSKDQVAAMATKNTTKASIIGGVDNKAHLLANKSTECGPILGILGPAILGLDPVAEGCKDRKKLIRFCQASAIATNGLCDSGHNKIRIPHGGHEAYFDGAKGPAWLFLPVKTLDEAAEFDDNKPYWVIPLAGLLDRNANNADKLQQDSLTALYPDDYRKYPENRALATKEDIEKAISFLVDCVKGLADVAANGVPTGLEGEEAPLLPLNLNVDCRKNWQELSTPKAEMMKATRDLLLAGEKNVLIPDFIEGIDRSNLTVLKVLVEPGLDPLPDPMLLGVKSALNWMAQNGQKPLPACPDPDSEDDEEIEDDEEVWDFNDTPCAVHNPSTPHHHVPGAVFFLPSIVTPPGESDGNLQSDLDSESDWDEDSVRALHFQESN